MADFRLVPVTSPIIGMDWFQDKTGLIDESASLITAVNVALMSDALADPNDALPDPRSDDRRGWWGDIDAAEIWGGWPLGSKIWLLSRTKIVDSGARAGATIARVQQYVNAAIQPFVDNKLASRFSVNAQQISSQRIDVGLVIYRGPKSAIDLRYQALWDELPPSPPFPAPKAVLQGPVPAVFQPPPGSLDFSGTQGSQFIPTTDGF